MTTSTRHGDPELDRAQDLLDEEKVRRRRGRDPHAMAAYDRLRALALNDSSPNRPPDAPRVCITVGTWAAHELLDAYEVLEELRAWIAKHTQPIDAAVFAELEDAVRGRAGDE